MKLLPPGKVGEMKLRGGIGEEGVKFKLANERAPVRPLKGCGAPKLLLGISSGLVKPLVTVGMDTGRLLTDGRAKLCTRGWSNRLLELKLVCWDETDETIARALD